jgi:hypothetical protein
MVLVLTLVVFVVAIVLPGLATLQGPDVDSNTSIAVAWAQKTDKKGKEKKGKEATKESTKESTAIPQSGGIDPTHAALIGVSAVALVVGVWVVTRRIVDDDEAAS